MLTVVPLGMLGGPTLLLLTGNSISFTASIGFIALIGIEIKNLILFVDFTNQLRAQGVPLATRPWRGSSSAASYHPRSWPGSSPRSCTS